MCKTENNLCEVEEYSKGETRCKEQCLQCEKYEKENLKLN